MPINRWFVRCIDCLAVSAVDEHPSLGDWRCGICNGQLENMGRVEKDRLIHEWQQAICDDRCTNAKGPLCSCKCGGKHHGSKRVVRVVKDAGPVPLVTPATGRDQARLNADDYHALRAAALAQLDPLLASRRRGYLPQGDYDRPSGRSPLDYLTRLGNRVVSLHLKDVTRGGEELDLGSGTVPLSEILRRAQVAGVKHYFVEDERPGLGYGHVERAFSLLTSLDF